MKEAMSGIPLFEITIVFILIFTGIMCLTINHAKAFGVKDEIINLIESEDVNKLINLNSLDQDLVKQITDKLADYGYRNDGECPDSSWTGYRRDGSIASGRDAAFCVRANDITRAYYADLEDKCVNNDCFAINEGLPPMVYYDIALFYQLDIPLTNALNFRVYGSTKIIVG